MRLFDWLNYYLFSLCGLVGIPEPEPKLSQFLQDRVKATREMSAADILARARSESRQKFYCPHCGQRLLENGCESCEHRTDDRDCLCEGCYPRLYWKKAELRTSMGGPPVRVDVSVLRSPDAIKVLFDMPVAVKSGETVYLSGRWDWYGTAD